MIYSLLKKIILDKNPHYNNEEKKEYIERFFNKKRITKDQRNELINLNNMEDN